jgi:hypothetical protein
VLSDRPLGLGPVDDVAMHAANARLIVVVLRTVVTHTVRRCKARAQETIDA